MAVKVAKSALTDYFTKNKLKRNEDYTDDAKHGSKIQRLQKEINKASDTLSAINDQVAALKPGKGKVGREMKYEYPADCKTAEQRKKYRIKMRKEAEGANKPKKESTKKAGKAETSEEAPAKTKKAAKTQEAVEEAPAKTKKVAKKKVKKASKDD